MSKRKSPKRYIYDNGVLILKYSENESTQTNNDGEYISRNTNKNLNIEFPILNQKITNYKIFSTEIGEDILGDKKKEESEKNINDIDEEEDTNKEEKEYSNLKSIEVKPTNMKKNPKLMRKLNKLKLSSDIKKICDYLYTSPRKSNKDNIQFKIFEKENEYIQHLTKNYLVNDDLINKQMYRNRIKKRKNFSSNQDIFCNKNNNTNKNLNTDQEIIKKYYDETNSNTIDIDKLTSYKFEHYKRNLPKYKHPQIYRLKNIIKDDDKDSEIKLPPIKAGNQAPIELTEFIPIKKGIKKEEQRNEYVHYKIMRTNRLEGFHI